MYKSYSELIKLETFKERFEYLKLNGNMSWDNRALNQSIYQSPIWRSVRRKIVIRDDGLDLGLNPIIGKIYIHHINPITKEDILNNSSKLYDPENLISCGYYTHTAIHYGDENILPKEFVERRPNDTCPWKECV